MWQTLPTLAVTRSTRNARLEEARQQISLALERGHIEPLNKACFVAGMRHSSHLMGTMGNQYCDNTFHHS